MNKKIYGIMFGLGVLCILESLIPGTTGAISSDRHKAWHVNSSGSWAINVGAKGVDVGVSHNFEDSHGAMVASAVRVGDLNQEMGLVGWVTTSMFDISEDEYNLVTADHDWDVKYFTFKPVENNDYYITYGPYMAWHHFRFNYKVVHDVNNVWPIPDEHHVHESDYVITIGVESNSGVT
ncbi:MAG: hypothetical protein ACOC40_01320 [Thermoplasmatota archaeon]